jgi:hypothetical protein
MRCLTRKPADLVLDVAVDGLLSVLAQITDPRSRFGRRYPLSAVLAPAVCAATCDANGFTAIAQWAADHSEEQLVRFGLRRGRYTERIAVPAERTFRLILARVDPGELLEAVGRYVTHRPEQAGMAKIPERATKEREARRHAKAAGVDKPLPRRVLAADGKTPRGSGRNRWTRTHPAAVVDHTTRTASMRASAWTARRTRRPRCAPTSRRSSSRTPC